jgi:hypothetical protein
LRTIHIKWIPKFTQLTDGSASVFLLELWITTVDWPHTPSPLPPKVPSNFWKSYKSRRKSRKKMKRGKGTRIEA